MRCCPIILTLFLIAGSLHSQSTQIDSLFESNNFGSISGQYRELDSALVSILSPVSLWRIAKSHYFTGENQESLSAYRLLLQKPMDDSLRALVSTGYVEVLTEIGAYEEARGIISGLDSWFQKDSASFRAARFLNAKGVFYLRQAYYDSAHRALSNACVLAVNGGFEEEFSMITTHLGILYRNMGDFARAIEQYSKSRKWVERYAQPKDLAVLQVNLGIVYYELGDFRKAISHFDSARAYYERIGDYAGISLVLGNTSNIYFDQHQFTQAESVLEEACTIAHKNGDRLGFDQWSLNWALVSLRLGKVAVAEERLRRIQNEFSELHRPLECAGVLLGLAECENQRGQLQKSKMFCLQATFELENAGYHHEAWVPLYESGRLCLQVGDTVDALSYWRKAVDVIEDARERVDDENLTEYFLEYDKQTVYRSLIGLLSKSGDISAAHDVFVQARFRNLKDRIATHAADSVLPGQITLEYFIHDSSIGVFILDGGMLDFVPLGEAKGLISAVTDLLSLLRAKGATRHIDLLRGRLWQILIDPIKDRFREVSHLRIVPDGILTYLPFEVLGDSSFLVQKFSISYCFSGTGKVGREQANWAGRLQMVSVDEFDGEAISLPGVEDESSRIRSIAGVAHLDVHEGYSRNLKTDILHIASHGVHDVTDPSMSGFIVRESWGGLRRVTAREIEGSLINTDLVVLSACETAIGEFLTGEGMLGLPRAFLIRGATSVVASLWRIDDKPSAVLMESFYAHLFSGESCADALQKAKIEMISAFPAQPWVWSAFVLWER